VAFFDPEKDRWPPVYDETQLAETIKDAASRPVKQFYEAEPSDRLPCQGDIISLSAEIPLLNERGEPFVEGEADTWLVVANTCDLARTVDENPWAPIVPVKQWTDVRPEEENAIKTYKVSRVFYLPPWTPDIGFSVADLTRFVTIHRAALTSVATLRARLRYPSWILLNACLVRYLTRNDGRHT